MVRLITLLVTLTFIAPPAFGQGAGRMKSTTGATTTLGTRNVPLRDGARALIAGRNETGVQLTLQGLELAQGKREEEAALSNLCAGYIQLEKYREAQKYCDMLLKRNENSWRGYNNRAVIFIQTKQYDKADEDLTRGEELNPGAHTLKVARAMYRDAVYPVRPEVEIDDRKKTKNEQPDAA
jgi:tetratricopeptide (TPR) repeat protein